MRQIITITVLLLAAFFAVPAAAEAETYRVKRGDTLGSIAQRFEVSVESVLQANAGIKNKDLIYPQQELRIPNPGDDKEGRESGFRYTNPGADPFTKSRDPVRLIDKFSCPQEVKEKFKKRAEDFLAGSDKTYTVKKGDALWKLEEKFNVSASKIYEQNKAVITHPDKWLFPGQELVIKKEKGGQSHEYESEFSKLGKGTGHISNLEEMGFGDYSVVSDIEVEYDEPQLARIWSVKKGNEVYYLVLPLNCYNWGWYKKVEKTTEPEPEPEPERREELSIIPPSPEKLERSEEEKRDWDPGMKANIYAGHYKGAQKGNSENWHQYLGGNISIFPHSFKAGEGRLRVGPSAQFTAWQGEADEVVDYSGDMLLLGAEADYLTKNSETSFKLYGGEKRGRVTGKGFPYKSRESADMIVTEGQYTWWYGDRNWFPQMEIGGRLQYSSNEEKESSIAGQEMDEPAVSQSEYSARYKTDIYGHSVATPTMELASGYREFDRSGFLEPRAGIEWFDDTAATDVSYLWLEHSQNDMAGVHVRLDVAKAGKKLKNWLSSDR